MKDDRSVDSSILADGSGQICKYKKTELRSIKVLLLKNEYCAGFWRLKEVM